MADSVIVIVILTCLAFAAVILSIESLLRWYTKKCVARMERKFDRLMEEMEEWATEEG